MKEPNIIYESGMWYVLGVNKIPPGGSTKEHYYEVYRYTGTCGTLQYLTRDLGRAKSYVDRHL